MKSISNRYDNEKYVITEEDICDLLLAYSNHDYEWIIYFFETLEPVQDSICYTFEELLSSAGITFQGK